MKEIAYTSLTATTEQGAMCSPCAEYKGMVDCPVCEATLCIYCADGCPECGAEINFAL